MLHIFLNNTDVNCPDYIFIKTILETYKDKITVVDEMVENGISMFTSGTFILRKNTAGVLSNLELAVDKNNKIVMIKPHGTSYLPMQMRKKDIIVCECKRSFVIEMIENLIK